jgi:hypothetical protein
MPVDRDGNPWPRAGTKGVHDLLRSLHSSGIAGTGQYRIETALGPDCFRISVSSPGWVSWLGELE